MGYIGTFQLHHSNQVHKRRSSCTRPPHSRGINLVRASISDPMASVMEENIGDSFPISSGTGPEAQNGPRKHFCSKVATLFKQQKRMASTIDPFQETAFPRNVSNASPAQPCLECNHSFATTLVAQGSDQALHIESADDPLLSSYPLPGTSFSGATADGIPPLEHPLARTTFAEILPATNQPQILHGSELRNWRALNTNPNLECSTWTWESAWRDPGQSQYARWVSICPEISPGTKDPRLPAWMPVWAHQLRRNRTNRQDDAEQSTLTQTALE